MEIIYTFISVLAVSLVSFVGVGTLVLKKEVLHGLLLELVSFSIGALLGGVFLHILPEAAEALGLTPQLGLIILGGLLFGFVMEKFVHWHHCHGSHCSHELHCAHEHGETGKKEKSKKEKSKKEKSKKEKSKKEKTNRIKPAAHINLFGDALHNFIDGVIIAAAYMTNVDVGVATTLAVLAHELPQEIGDFAVLIHAGLARGKALLLNFASALTALLGAAITLMVGQRVVGLAPYLLAFAAGTFIYLAGTDLIPELHKETKPLRSLAQLLAILAGIGVMLLV